MPCRQHSTADGVEWMDTTLCRKPRSLMLLKPALACVCRFAWSRPCLWPLLPPSTQRSSAHRYFDVVKSDSAKSVDNPLAWWRDHEKVFPRVAKLAKKYLASPGTSITSERGFSKGGIIVDPLRCSLSDEHTGQLMFLAMNNKLIPR